jgi:hypothetical protein
MSRPSPFIFPLILIFSCGGGGDSTSSDTGGLDAGPGSVLVDIVSSDDSADAELDQSTPDVLGSDSFIDLLAIDSDSKMSDLTVSPVCVPPGITGVVVDQNRAPIPAVRLFLCGIIDGKDTCSRGETDAQGYFAYQELSPGFEHMEINGALAGVAAGVRYGGLDVLVNTGGETCQDLGQIVLPEIAGDQMVVAAMGGEVDLGPAILRIPPDCLVFPDFQSEEVVAGAEVSLEDAFHSAPDDLLSLSLWPYGTICEQGMELVFKDPGLLGAQALANAVDHGGLISLGTLESSIDGPILRGIPYLSWLYLR